MLPAWRRLKGSYATDLKENVTLVHKKVAGRLGRKWPDVVYMDGFVQDFSDPSASAMELLQSCTKIYLLGVLVMPTF